MAYEILFYLQLLYMNQKMLDESWMLQDSDKVHLICGIIIYKKWYTMLVIFQGLDNCGNTTLVQMIKNITLD